MKSTGYALKERAYIGSVTPPDTFEDESRFGKDGTHTNVTWVKTPAGLWARRFNGVNAVVVIPLLSEITKAGTYTFHAWIKPDAVSGAAKTIFENVHASNDRNGMITDTSELQVGYYNGSSYVGKSGAITNAWSFVVGKNDGGTIYLTINDAIQTGTNLSGLNSTDQGFRLGLKGDNTQDYAGLIVKVRVCNYVTPNEYDSAIFHAEKHWFGR